MQKSNEERLEQLVKTVEECLNKGGIGRAIGTAAGTALAPEAGPVGGAIGGAIGSAIGDKISSKMGKKEEVLEKPPVSQAQRGAMHAAAAGNSTLGIPKSVGKEFADADKGGKLPEHAKKAEDDQTKGKQYFESHGDASQADLQNCPDDCGKDHVHVRNQNMANAVAKADGAPKPPKPPTAEAPKAEAPKPEQGHLGEYWKQPSPGAKPKAPVAESLDYKSPSMKQTPPPPGRVLNPTPNKTMQDRGIARAGGKEQYENQRQKLNHMANTQAYTRSTMKKSEVYSKITTEALTKSMKAQHSNQEIGEMLKAAADTGAIHRNVLLEWYNFGTVNPAVLGVYFGEE